MEVTTWAKRRQGDMRAVTQVKPNEPRDKDPDADTLEYVEGQGKVAATGKATGSPAGSKGTARVEKEASEEPGRSHRGLGRYSRVCQLKGPSIGRQTPRGKSDPLIVLRARESRVHGEAREQDKSFSEDTSPAHRGRIRCQRHDERAQQRCWCV